VSADRRIPPSRALEVWREALLGPRPEVGEGYRRLGVGELARADDEVWVGDRWVPVAEHAGETVRLADDVRRAE
jgi:hypothetical protein